MCALGRTKEPPPLPAASASAAASQLSRKLKVCLFRPESFFSLSYARVKKTCILDALHTARQERVL
jgi:hypothetical protein